MLHLANIFGDGCVLQHGSPVPVFGKATPGDTVSVLFHDHAASAVTDENGGWTVQLPAMPVSAEGSVLTVENRTSQERFSIHDVVVGEVWLTSGQSNMSLPINWFERASAGAGEEAIHTEAEKTRRFCGGFPLVRCARVCDHLQAGEDGDYKERAAWVPFNGESSIVSYVFGVQLFKALEVPIGLLNCSYSGSALYQWTEKTFVYNFNMLPALGYRVKGFLWYQGEHDANYPSMTEEYPARFAKLVSMVRETFPCPDPLMPVISFQLPRFNETEGAHWVEFRRRQEVTDAGIENHELICTIDHGTPGTIHPVDKVEISVRAAERALDFVYHIPGHEARSPVALSAARCGDAITVRFSAPIRLVGDDVHHLVLTDAEDVALPLSARVEGDCLTVTSPEMARAAYISYQCLVDTDPNLFGAGDFPVFPFRLAIVAE